MYKNKEELLKSYNTLIGDTPTEEQLSFMEDLSDSFVTPVQDNYKEKYEAVLQKYRERFLESDIKADIREQETVTDTAVTVDDSNGVNTAPSFEDIFQTTYIRR